VEILREGAIVKTERGKVSQFLSGVEWRWSLLQFGLGLPAAVASFVLPAWAISATTGFERFAPLSWVAAGFLGLLIASGSYALAAKAFARRIRTKYDARMLASGGAIDPLEKTFERKRIYLNEFCLPSHPFIEDKSFIDCEIIGPANMLFVAGNSIMQGKYPICDAVYLSPNSVPNNVYLFKDCIFRGCNFSRVTYFVANEETEMFKDYNLVRWITNSPYDQLQLPLAPPTTSEGILDNLPTKTKSTRRRTAKPKMPTS